jgi:DNA-binding NtrC family response regulator
MASRVAERESMSTAVRAIPREEVSPAESLFLLIVDADRWSRDLSREVAASVGFKVHTADNTRAALRQMELQPVDVVLLDVRQSSQDGVDLLAKFKEIHPQTEIIIVSGQATIDSVVTAMKSGACDFIRKPFKGEEMKALLTRAAGRLRNSLEDRISREHLQPNAGYNGMLGNSPEMQKLYRIVTKVATSKHPVLVHGESGTGKETVARAIHANGPFHDRPFLLVDCAATGNGVLENELFGPIKSSNGSAKSRDGMFALASGGTVFFDEIGEMPLDVQGKLVRALQEREFHVQGNGKSIPVDVRIVAGTSRDLEMAVQQGTFRRDLFFRLNVAGIALPPLRERRDDIPLMVEHFLAKTAKRDGRATPKAMEPAALARLCGYRWPGNVRELENVVQRTLINSSGLIRTADLPLDVRQEAGRRRFTRMERAERDAIMKALETSRGNKVIAAEELGISRSSLYRKIERYGLADAGQVEMRVRG